MKGKKQKSIIKKLVVIVFALLLVSFVSMNVITIKFFKAKMSAIQGIDQAAVVHCREVTSNRCTTVQRLD